LNRGVEKGSIDVYARPVKADDRVRILLLLLDPDHVIVPWPDLVGIVDGKVTSLYL